MKRLLVSMGGSVCLLTAVAGDMDAVRKRTGATVLTPHAGEMARLSGQPLSTIRENPIGAVQDAAEEWGAVVVLKGARTVVAEPQGNAWINTTGNPGMATAGTGDVLTGMIAGLAAQGMKPLDAALSGVYLHGACGDGAARRRGERGLLARDLLHELPKVLPKVRTK